MTQPKAVPRRQAERSAESAQRLLDATIQLIAEKGFERTTAAEIGERAGYSREMVRHRYGSKEKLLESLMDEYRERLLRPSSGEGAGLDRALEQIDHIAETAAESPRLLRAFYVLCFEAVGPVSELAGWMREWLAAYRVEVAKALRKGQADGSVRSGVEPEAEARDVIVFGSGLAFSWTLEPDAVDYLADVARWRKTLRSRWAA